jgi:beta-lactamase class A
MSHSSLRRALLIALAAGPVIGVRAQPASSVAINLAAHERFEQLEARSGGRLGVAALNTADGSYVGYRESERFAMCSTFKLLAVAAILKRSIAERALLDSHIRYGETDLVANSPATKRHVSEGMSMGDICAAALQYSDNTAANLMIRLLGGPGAVTAFARSIGDSMFRLDRWETALNEAVPGDPRDTTTPAAMLNNLQALVLGEALSQSSRERLIAWLVGNKTGDARLRAGLPATWRSGDKTGSGEHGTSNDVAVAWPPNSAPVLIAVYLTGTTASAEARNQAIAAIGSALAARLRA